MPAPAAIIPVVLDTSAIPRQFSDALVRAQRSVKPLSVKINPLPLSRITSDVLELNKSMDAATARVIAFGATTTVIYAMARAFGSLVSSTILVEKRMIAISSILNTSTAGFKKLGDGLFRIANEVSVSFEEATQVAEEFARQGLSLNETLRRTKDALSLVKLGNIESKEAVSNLTAAMNTFRREALDTTTIVNKLATVDAAFAVNQKDLSDAISRAGASAQSAKLDLDELLGTVTSLQQITARGGSVIGNALKSIFTRVSRPEVLDTLRALGVEVESMPGKVKPALEILKGLAKEYRNLSEAQRSVVSEKVAGIYQINQFKALIADLGQVNSLVDQATKTSRDSAGSASSRIKELNTSLSALAQQAGNNLTRVFSKIGESAIVPNLKGVLKTFNSFFREVEGGSDGDTIGSKIGAGILSGISAALKGPGTFTALAVLTGSVKKIGGFVLNAIKDLSHLNRTTEEQQLIQGSINRLLATGNSYYAQRYRTSTSETEKQQIILSLLRQQNAEITRQGSRGAAIGSLLGKKYVGSESGNITPRASAGYVPNFNNAAAVAAEERDIKLGVGGATGARPKLIQNFKFGGGKKGDIVANTKEILVENFAGNDGTAVFNPAMVRAVGGVGKLKKLGRVKAVANGYIPNFNISRRFTRDFSGLNRDTLQDYRDRYDLQMHDSSPYLFRGVSQDEIDNLKELGVTTSLGRQNLKGKLGAYTTSSLRVASIFGDSRRGGYSLILNRDSLLSRPHAYDMRLKNSKSLQNAVRVGRIKQSDVLGVLNHGDPQVLGLGDIHHSKDKPGNYLNYLSSLAEKDSDKQRLIKLLSLSDEDLLNRKAFAGGYIPNFARKQRRFELGDLIGAGAYKEVYDVKSIQPDLFDKSYPTDPSSVVAAILRRSNTRDFANQIELEKSGLPVPKIYGFDNVKNPDTGKIKNAAIMERVKMFSGLASEDLAITAGYGRSSEGRARVESDLSSVLTDFFRQKGLISGGKISHAKSKHPVYGDLAVRNLGYRGEEYEAMDFLREASSLGRLDVKGAELKYGDINYLNNIFERSGLVVVDSGYLKPRKASRGYIPNFAQKFVGKGSYGSYFKFLRSGEETGLGKKVPHFGHVSDALGEFYAGQILHAAGEAGIMGAAVSGARVFGSPSRIYTRGSYGKQYVSDPIAYKGRESELLKSARARGHFDRLTNDAIPNRINKRLANSISVGMPDMHWGNYSVDNRTLTKLARYSNKLSLSNLTTAETNDKMSEFAERIITKRDARISIFDSGPLYRTDKLIDIDNERKTKEILDRVREHSEIRGEMERGVVQIASGYIPNFADALKAAMKREREATGKIPKVGYDNRVGIGVFSPDQGSLTNAVNQHLRDEPGRNLSNIKQTGLPNFAPKINPIAAAGRLDVLAKQVEDFAKQQKRIADEKERELLISKALTDDEFKRSDRSRLNALNAEKIADELGTSVKEINALRKSNPLAYEKSGLRENVFGAARRATDSALNNGNQERLIRQFATDIVEKVGVFGSAERARDKFLAANKGKLGRTEIESINDITRDRTQQNVSKRERLLFGASFALPFLTEIGVNALGNPNSQGGRLTSGVGTALGTSLNIGSLIAQAGSVRGGVGAGLLSFGALGSKALTSSSGAPIGLLSKELNNVTGKIDESENLVNAVVNELQNLREIRDSGGSQAAIGRATKAVANALTEVQNSSDKTELARLVGTDASYEDIAKFRSDRAGGTVLTRKGASSALRIAEATELLPATGNFVQNRLLGDRRSLIAASQGDSGIDRSARLAYYAVTGRQATLAGIRSAFPNLNNNELDFVKSEVIGNFSAPKFNRGGIDLPKLESARAQGVDSAGLLDEALRVGGSDVISRKRLLDSLLTTSLEDSNKVLDSVISFLKEDRDAQKIASAGTGAATASSDFVKLTKESISAVGFRTAYGARNFANTSGLAIEGLKGRLDNSSVGAFGQIAASRQISDAEAKREFISGFTDTITESLSGVRETLLRNSGEIGYGNIKTEIAQALLSINNNPLDAVSQYQKIADALAKTNASSESVESIRNAGLDAGQQLSVRKQGYEATLAANRQAAALAEEAEKKRRSLSFLGGDFNSVANNRAGEYYSGLASLNTPLSKSRNKRFADQYNAPILGEQASLFEKLFSDGIITPESGIAGLGRSKIQQAAELNYGSTLDELARGTKDPALKAAIEAAKKNIPEAARARAEQIIPLASDPKLTAGIGGVNAQLDSIKAQLEASSTQTDALKANTLAVTQLTKIINSAAVESAPAGSGEPDSLARGFVPNFSALTREMAAIRSGVGGARVTDKPAVRHIGGLGTAVVNTGEKIVRNFMGSGKDAVFNRSMLGSFGDVSSLGRVENVASGFVPNFALGGLFGNSIRDKAIDAKYQGNLVYYVDTAEKGYVKDGVRYVTSADIANGYKIAPNARVVNFSHVYGPLGNSASGVGYGSNNIRPLGPRRIPASLGDNKLLEARSTKYIPDSVSFREAFDKTRSGAGRGKRVTSLLRSTLNNNFLLKRIDGANSVGIKTNIPQANTLLNDFRPALLNPDKYFAQQYVPPETRLNGAPKEYRVHVGVDDSGKTRVAYGATSNRNDLTSNIKNGDRIGTAAEKLARKAVQDYVKNTGVRRAAFGLDIGRVDPAFAAAENKRLKFNRYQISGFGANRIALGVYELNPTSGGGGSGFSALPGVRENIARSIQGQLPEGVSRTRFALDAIKAGDFRRLGDLSSVSAAQSVIRSGASAFGTARDTVRGLGNSIRNSAPYNAIANIPAKFSAQLAQAGGTKQIGKSVLTGIGKSFIYNKVDEVIQNTGLDDGYKKASTIGAAYLTGQFTPLGAGITTAGDIISTARSVDASTRDAALARVERDFSSGKTNLVNQLVGEGIGTIGDSVFGEGGGASLRQSVSYGSALLISGLANTYNKTLGRVFGQTDAFSLDGLRAPSSVSNEELPVPTLSSAGSSAAATSNPKAAAFLSSLDRDLSELANPTIDRNYRQELFKSTAGTLQALKAGVANPGNSDPSAVAVYRDYLNNYPGKQTLLQAQLDSQIAGRDASVAKFSPDAQAAITGRIGLSDDELLAEYGYEALNARKYYSSFNLASGHVPNFARSIVKRFGKLGTLQNIIQSGDRREARDYIARGGLPQSYINAGYGPQDLDAIAAAIEREKEALYARGISRNLASGYIFAGYHPRVGVGIGNTIDEPAGRYNTTAGLAQGINRVASQGGNPARSGVPNYADAGNSDYSELVQAINSLIASLSQSGENNETANGEVQVSHSISVNASINGVIESNNAAVQTEVNSAIEQLKARLAALEAAQRSGKYSPPPPTRAVTV